MCIFNYGAGGKETKIKRLISDHFPPSKIFSDLMKIICKDNSYINDQGRFDNELVRK